MSFPLSTLDQAKGCHAWYLSTCWVDFVATAVKLAVLSILYKHDVGT